MRTLYFALFALASCVGSHASTIDHFTYTYTLAGSTPSTFTTTFKLTSDAPADYVSVGQTATAPSTYKYNNVAINDDPNTRVNLEFTAGSNAGYFILRPATGALDIADFGVSAGGFRSW